MEKKVDRDMIYKDNLIAIKLAFDVSKKKKVEDLYALMDTTRLRYTNSISELDEAKSATINEDSKKLLIKTIKLSQEIIDGTKRFDIGFSEECWEALRKERAKKAKVYKEVQDKAYEKAIGKSVEYKKAEDEKIKGVYYKKLRDRIRELYDNPDECQCLDFKKVIAYIRDDRGPYGKLMMDNLERQLNIWLKFEISDMIDMDKERLATLNKKIARVQRRITGILEFGNKE